MSESKLRDLSMDFSVQIINLVKELKAKHESVISNQIGRSGTSIGANIYETNFAQGTKDFISKLEIALKNRKDIEPSPVFPVILFMLSKKALLFIERDFFDSIRRLPISVPFSKKYGNHIKTVI